MYSLTIIVIGLLFSVFLISGTMLINYSVVSTQVTMRRSVYSFTFCCTTSSNSKRSVCYYTVQVLFKEVRVAPPLFCQRLEGYIILLVGLRRKRYCQQGVGWRRCDDYRKGVDSIIGNTRSQLFSNATHL